MQRGVAIGGLCLLATVGAVATASADSRQGDLDGDGRQETVRSVEEGGRVEVRVADDCPSGTQIDRRIAGPEDRLVLLALTSADSVTGLETLVDLASNSEGDVGDIRLVAWREVAGDVCARPIPLFKYLRPTKRPSGAERIATFEVAVRNLTKRYQGKEIRLIERFAIDGEANACASIEKRSYYRYRSATDRYVRYKSKVLRGRAPSGCD